MSIRAVIFDLDDTLVSSSSVRKFREAGDWNAVQAQLPHISRFEGIDRMLRHIQTNGCKIAVVTSSPRWYAEALIANHAFPVDAIIAAGDYQYGKPNPEPISKAMQALRVYQGSEILGVGDRCIDTASAHAAGVIAIGATWGAANLRDLRISWPEYLASTPEEVVAIFDALRLNPTPMEGIGKKHGWTSGLTSSDVWITNPSDDHRRHLSGVYDYSHARYKYADGWNGSCTNAMIKSLKAKSQNQRFFKDKAVAHFAMELSWFLPANSFVTFVLPSTKKGEAGYDDRFEMVAARLSAKNINCIWPIAIKESTEAAHTLPPDSPLRDPAVIMSNLEWVTGLPPECQKIYVIDDVLTKGGHLRAYADFIRQAYPHITVQCVAWAVHTSAQWYV